MEQGPPDIEHSFRGRPDRQRLRHGRAHRRPAVIRRALPLALLALLAVPAAGQAKRVRVFAVGPKFSFDWVDTRAHYHDKLLALVDKTKRGGAPTIQAGADDVASHLRGTASNSRLVVLPEDIGLMSAFVGSRGDNARNPNAGLAGAILTLEVGYAPVMAYYGNKYQSVAQRPAATRLLALALTDTFARTAVETFAELARTYHTYLEAGVNMAQSWQVVCKSKATFK